VFIPSKKTLYTLILKSCEIMKQYDVAFLWVMVLRPGSIVDANDAAQFAELRL